MLFEGIDRLLNAITIKLSVTFSTGVLMAKRA